MLTTTSFGFGNIVGEIPWLAVIAAVVVGGTAVTGGRGTLAGTLSFAAEPADSALEASAVEARLASLRLVTPKTASEQAAYSKWLDQTSDREQARQAGGGPAAAAEPQHPAMERREHDRSAQH